jgi:hypothetical protein
MDGYGGISSNNMSFILIKQPGKPGCFIPGSRALFIQFLYFAAMRWRMRNSVIMILFICCMAGVLQAQTPRDISLSAISDVKLWNASGKKEVPLGRDDKMKLIVLLSPECPMSVNYTLTLNQISEKFRDRLEITGVIPGRTVKDDEVNRFASAYKLTFPLLVDKDRILVRMVKGKVTPEAFLFNADGTLVYSGAIDNWLTELGKKKQKPDMFFLQDAILNTINGSPVTVPYVKAQGCLVNDY